MSIWGGKYTCTGGQFCMGNRCVAAVLCLTFPVQNGLCVCDELQIENKNLLRSLQGSHPRLSKLRLKFHWVLLEDEEFKRKLSKQKRINTKLACLFQL